MKICRHCGPKPDDAFAPNQRVCRVCRNEIDRSNRALRAAGGYVPRKRKHGPGGKIDKDKVPPGWGLAVRASREKRNG
jgi:hypothetical protein